jgi:hypothetical protein
MAADTPTGLPARVHWEREKRSQTRVGFATYRTASPAHFFPFNPKRIDDVTNDTHQLEGVPVHLGPGVRVAIERVGYGRLLVSTVGLHDSRLPRGGWAWVSSPLVADYGPDPCDCYLPEIGADGTCGRCGR